MFKIAVMIPTMQFTKVTLKADHKMLKLLVTVDVKEPACSITSRLLNVKFYGSLWLCYILH